MDAKETIQDVAALLWDAMTEERGGGGSGASPQPIEITTVNPYDRFAEAGHDGITREELLEAIEVLAVRMDSSQSEQLQALRQSVEQLPAQINSDAPLPPAPVTHVTQKHVTVVNESQTQVTNEGDTTIDNRVLTEIHARGDVAFDQEIDNTTVIADDGGVAVGGDLEESAVNTGINTGVVAGDDIQLQDSIVGDGNDQVNDTEAGAISTDDGSATNAEGENVNLGSGELTDVDSAGDSQVITGDENEVTGSVDTVSVDAVIAIPAVPAEPVIAEPVIPEPVIPEPVIELPPDPLVAEVQPMDLSFSEEPADLFDDGLDQ